MEKLRSDDIKEREAAMRQLKELGRAAVPELEKAAKDPETEVAGRARFLLRLFAVRDLITPGLKKAMPGIEEQLA